MEKYDHIQIEKKWREKWEKEKLNVVDIKRAKKPFYNLMMFPYPSAEGLHVGNMYAFTAADIYGRFKRLQGYDVFEPIGLDGFGIHSENYALKVGRHPKEHAAITEKNFYAQLHKIGCMFDWSRTVETYHPDYYKWTQWVFVQMFKAGLAYRCKASVNFCPKDKTVLSDEQVIDGKCERCGTPVEKREVEQWFFKITEYAEKLQANLDKLHWSEKVKIAQRNWIGKKEGVVISHQVKELDLTLDTFSAYPAWLYADTFIVMAPDHELVSRLVEGTKGEADVKKFVEKYLLSHGNKIRTKLDEKEGIFTGRSVADPITGKDLPIWLANFALKDFGTGIIRCSAHDPRDVEFAQKYKIPLKQVVTIPDGGFVNAHENKGRLLDSGQFTGREINIQLIEEMVDFFVKQRYGKRKTSYHLRDWLVSRQRYWGAPIPMIYCAKCARLPDGQGWQAVPEAELPVLLPDIADYQPEGQGKGPLAKHKEFYETKCPNCAGPATRETDVCDTFLDSSWYELRYPSLGLPDSGKVPFDPEITKKWLPVNMYTGGAEHAVLHLMYFRFVTMALFDMKLLPFEEPCLEFFAHGLLIKEGAKMSKSKGNVVNPDEYIAKFGADALRLYLMFMGPVDQGGDFRDSGMIGMRRWVEKVWRILGKSLAEPNDKQDVDLERAINRLVAKAGKDIEMRHYNTAISAMMEFANEVGEKHLSKRQIKIFLVVLAPFAPHLAQELWKEMGNNNSVHNQAWPSVVEDIARQNVTIVLSVNGKPRGVLEFSSQEVKMLDEDRIVREAQSNDKIAGYLRGKEIRRVVYVPGKIVNFVV